jgi:hypothetical protein
MCKIHMQAPGGSLKHTAARNKLSYLGGDYMTARQCMWDPKDFILSGAGTLDTLAFVFVLLWMWAWRWESAILPDHTTPE